MSALIINVSCDVWGVFKVDKIFLSLAFWNMRRIDHFKLAF